MRIGIWLVVILGFLISGAYHTRAADPQAIAVSVPVEVAEVVNGGSWSQEGKTGFYRAIVIIPGGGPANVFVQLLSLAEENTPPAIIVTVPIKEVSEQSFASAFLAMDAETDNEMILIVTGFGSGTDQDTAMHFKFDGKGSYTTIVTPGDDSEVEESTPKN